MKITFSSLMDKVRELSLWAKKLSTLMELISENKH
jgi:hypothetical protein